MCSLSALLLFLYLVLESGQGLHSLSLIFLIFMVKKRIDRRLKTGFLAERSFLKFLCKTKKKLNTNAQILYDVELESVNLDAVLVSETCIMVFEVKSSCHVNIHRNISYLKHAMFSVLKKRGVVLRGFPVYFFEVSKADLKNPEKLTARIMSAKRSSRVAFPMLKEAVTKALLVGPRGFEPRTYGL